MYTPRSASLSKSTSSGRSARYSTSSTQGGAFSPGLLQHRANQSANRSLQTSQIIEETPTHIIQNFGVALPVLVTEVLTVSDRNADISVKLSESGWAWLVCSRRLLIWKYKNVAGFKTSAQCRELTLPPSDLAHKAELVCVFMCSDNQIPSAIAVSPEGFVRYWPSIAHEGSSVETSAELHGQECYSLTDALPLGCIVATTTSTLMLVTADVVGGQSAVLCRHLKVPQGMLAGIGRRVSSFIFGSMPNQSTESKLVKVLVAPTEHDNEKLMYVLSGCNLQKWALNNEEADKLLFECDVDRHIREHLVETLWGREVYDANQIDTWLVDMQLTAHSVVVLAAGRNRQVSPQVYYAFGTLQVLGGGTPAGLSSFAIAKHTEQYTEHAEDTFLGYRFLLSTTSRHTAFMYGSKVVFCLSILRSTEESDKLEFRSQGDKILGAGTCDGSALFFSINHGIISLKSTGHQQQFDTSAVEEPTATLSQNLTFSEGFLPSDDNGESQDTTTRLKGAFLTFFKQSQAASKAVVDALFPPTMQSLSEKDSSLNTSIIAISQELIDDYPASDPRWAESVPRDATSTTLSLIMLHQLEDKQRAHEVFIEFLKGVQLWHKMSLVTVRDMPMPTRLHLCEHAEKVVAAIALRSLHSQYSLLIDKAIAIVLATRNIIPLGKLTNQDVFYREISEIHRIVQALIQCEMADSNHTSAEYVKTIMAVNTIIQTILSEACHYRNNKASVYHITSSEPDTEYLPWTASSGNEGLRTLLMKQHALTVEVASLGVEDVNAHIYQQLMELADLILDGYRVQLDSISNSGDGELFRSVNQRNQADRYNLIKPLLEAQEYDRAASLAEKYYDCRILVELCEETNNQERLQHYMAKFADKKFSDYVFKWYLEEGKRGKLLSQPFMQNTELGMFLEKHHSLSWLHDLHTNNFQQAQATLKELAISEKDYIAKKKTLLSLSKLAALTLDAPSDAVNELTEDINKELELVGIQESLPPSVLQSLAFDPDNMKVLSPVELVKLYTCEENTASNEFDFKKALDLLQYINKDTCDTDVEQLKLHIWCRAVLKDSWADADMDSPIEACNDTVFFKVVDLIFNEGLELHEYIPPIDDLLQAEELSELRESPEFEFLLRAGYEQFLRFDS